MHDWFLYRNRAALDEISSMNGVVALLETEAENADAIVPGLSDAVHAASIAVAAAQAAHAQAQAQAHEPEGEEEEQVDLGEESDEEVCSCFLQLRTSLSRTCCYRKSSSLWNLSTGLWISGMSLKKNRLPNDSMCLPCPQRNQNARSKPAGGTIPHASPGKGARYSLSGPSPIAYTCMQFQARNPRHNLKLQH
jgi:hypothetical protein